MKKKKRFPTIAHLLGILLLFTLFTLPFGILQGLSPKSFEIYATVIAYIAPMLLVIWATRRIHNKKGKLNFSPNHLTLLPFIVVGTYAFLLVGEFTVSLLPEPTGIIKKLFDAMNNAMKNIFEHQYLGFFMIAIAAPILEEILFRGIILKSLLKKTKPWNAILITAVAFGVFHLNPWQFLYATTIGIFLGYIYWKTKSLFYPILIHFILNATAFVGAQYIENFNESLPDTIGDMKKFYMMVGFSLLIIGLLYKYFEDYFAKHAVDKLVLATQNKHKIEEIKKILPNHINLEFLKDISFQGDLIETGDTLDANAKQKMRQIAVPYDVDVLADDTGLEVDALNGAPGVYSARYAGEDANYQDNVDKLLKEMKGVENRTARFRTIIALSNEHQEKYFEGAIEGHIATEARGTNGFGYDSVFIPEGYDKTFAEMTDDEKNAISHRSRALQKLKVFFEEKYS